MVLNALGAAYAVCLFAAAGGRAPFVAGTRAPVWRRRAALVLGGLVPLAAWLDPSRLDSFWQRATTGRPYRVLSAPEALLITILLWLLVTWFCGAGRREREHSR